MMGFAWGMGCCSVPLIGAGRRRASTSRSGDPGIRPAARRLAYRCLNGGGDGRASLSLAPLTAEPDRRWIRGAAALRSSVARYPVRRASPTPLARAESPAVKILIIINVVRSLVN